MTVSTTTSVVTYQGNGSTLTFTFPFIGDGPSDLEVIYTDSTGAASTLNPSVYTLVINPVPVGGLWGIGGSVTYPNTGSPPTPIAVGTFLTINRIVPYEQTVTISNQGAFYPQSVETGLDLLELQIQQLETAQQYSLQTPISDLNPPNILPPAAERADGYLYFDSTGQPTIVPTVIPPTPGPPQSYATPRKITVSGTSTSNILFADSFGGVSIYQSGSPVTTLQLPAGEGPYPIFDASGNASTYPITVLPSSGKTINGLSQYRLTYNNQSVTIYWDGTGFLIA